jgi:cellulose biosynthesis protein BcsQ
MPSLGMLTINALAAADSVLIPVQAQYLPAKGLEQLLYTVNKVRKQINPKLKIEGILLTMVDGRTNDARDISTLLRETYGTKLKVFDTTIPHSVRAAETVSCGKIHYIYENIRHFHVGLLMNIASQPGCLVCEAVKSRVGVGTYTAVYHYLNNVKVPLRRM